MVTPPLHARRARGTHDDQTRFDRVAAILAPLTHPKPNPAKVRPKQAQGPSITVVIRATDFPGKACGPGPKGEMFDDIQVGLAHRRDTIELVSGGARETGWTFNMTVRRDDAGQLDFGGPFVLGHKDDRHFGLRWVTTSMEEELEVFRVAKLRLADIDRGLLEAAVREKRDLIADVTMTDRDGMPICARVRPPFVEWSLSG